MRAPATSLAAAPLPLESGVGRRWPPIDMASVELGHSTVPTIARGVDRADWLHGLLGVSNVRDGHGRQPCLRQALAKRWPEVRPRDTGNIFDGQARRGGELHEGSLPGLVPRLHLHSCARAFPPDRQRRASIWVGSPRACPINAADVASTLVAPRCRCGHVFSSEVLPEGSSVGSRWSTCSTPSKPA